eukprot:583115-Hanusia_phi.AAC.2
MKGKKDKKDDEGAADVYSLGGRLRAEEKKKIEFDRKVSVFSCIITPTSVLDHPSSFDHRRKPPFPSPLQAPGIVSLRILPSGITSDLVFSQGCDITVGEMALASKVRSGATSFPSLTLLQIVEGNGGEWALFRRHVCEDVFGIQVNNLFPSLSQPLVVIFCATFSVHLCLNFIRSPGDGRTWSPNVRSCSRESEREGDDEPFSHSPADVQQTSST